MCHVDGVGIAVWHGPTTELMSSRHTHVPPRAAEQRSRIPVRITCVAASKRHCPADTTTPCCRGARRCNAATSSRGTRRLPPAPRAPRGVLPRSRRCRSSSSTWPNARNASSASGHSAVASRGETRAKRLSGAESSLKQPGNLSSKTPALEEGRFHPPSVLTETARHQVYQFMSNDSTLEHRAYRYTTYVVVDLLPYGFTT